MPERNRINFAKRRARDHLQQHAHADRADRMHGIDFIWLLFIIVNFSCVFSPPASNDIKQITHSFQLTSVSLGLQF